MNKEILDRIVELLKSDDHEHNALGKAVFVLNEPSIEDCEYLHNTQYKDKSFQEKFIEELERKIKPPIPIARISAVSASVITAHISVYRNVLSCS